jgi:hypothetical protein
MIGGYCDSIVTVENRVFVPGLPGISLKNAGYVCTIECTPLKNFILMMIGIEPR